DLSRMESVQIGVAEKTFQSYGLSVKGKGGHSSVPPTDFDPVVTLSRALQRIGELRFPAKVLPEAREGIALRALHEKPPLSDALKHVAQAGTVSPEDDAVIGKDQLANAQIRTTCVTTMLKAAPQDNVLPTTAEATVNCRILPDETREQTQARLAQAIGDPAVELKPLEDIGFAKPSPISGPVNEAVHGAVRALWGEVPVSHAMGTGATDSRHLRAIGIQSYGLGGAALVLRRLDGDRRSDGIPLAALARAGSAAAVRDARFAWRRRDALAQARARVRSPPRKGHHHFREGIIEARRPRRRRHAGRA